MIKDGKTIKYILKICYYNNYFKKYKNNGT